MTTEDDPKNQTTFQRLRQTRAWRWGSDIAFALLIFFAISAWQGRDLIRTAEPAPAVSLTRMDTGERMGFEALKGKKSVVVLWAPWCGVCKAEVGALNALSEALGDDAQLVSVALAYEDRADVQRFIDAQGVRYPVLLGDDRAQRAMRVNVFPTTYILDEQGRIAHALVGYTTSWGLRLRLWWT